MKERIVPLLQRAVMVVWDPSLYSVKVFIQSAVPEPFYCFEREIEREMSCHVRWVSVQPSIKVRQEGLGTFLSGWGAKWGCLGATLRNGTKRLQPASPVPWSAFLADMGTWVRASWSW